MKHYLLSFFLFISGCLAIQPARAQWLGALTGSDIAYPKATTLDGAGNTYVTGLYDGALMLNNSVILPGNATGVVSYKMFVAKFSPQGTLLWALGSGNTYGSSSGEAVATDANGNVTVTGTFTGSLPLNGSSGSSITLTATTNATESYVVRYTAQGVVLAAWVVRGTSSSATGNYTCSSLAVDAAANSYVTGQREYYDYQSTKVNDAFVRKYSNQGQLLWAKEITNTGGYSPTLTLAGTSVLVTGSFVGTVVFTSQTSLTNRGIYGAFYNAQTGDLTSAALLTNTGNYPVVQADATGFYLAGSFQTAVVLSGIIPLSGNANRASSFLARFDLQGNAQWGKTLGGSGQSTVGITGLALYPTSDHLLVAGSFIGTVDLSSTVSYTTSGDADAFVADYSSTGVLRGARRDGSATANDNITSVARDPSGGSQPIIVGWSHTATSNASTSTTILGTSLPIRSYATEGFVGRAPNFALATQRAASVPAPFSAYPNPSLDGQLHLQLAASNSPVTIYLSTLLGQQVSKQTVTGATTAVTIPTSTLAPGQYIVRVATAEASNSQLIQVK